MRARPTRLLLLLGALALAAGSSRASTYLVIPDGSGDTPSIAAALRLAVSGDVIELGDGVFSGLGNTELDFAGKALTLRSRSGNPAACILDAAAGPAAPARILSLVSGEGAATLIEDIGFRGAYLANADGGALLLAGSDAHVRGCRFNGNTAREGGAVFVAGGAPRFEDCLFTGNHGGNSGGGLAATAGAQVTVTDCHFTSNTADFGAALMADGAALTLAGCLLFHNSAGGRGGGVYAGDRATLSLARCTLAYCNAVAGGGLSLATLSSLNMAQTIIAFAQAGAAVELRFGSTAQVACSDLFDNAGGDWTGDLAALLGQAGNIALDPEFCGDAGDGDLTLAAGSPCAAPACGAMGGAGVGCAGRTVSFIDFGTLKQLYGGD